MEPVSVSVGVLAAGMMAKAAERVGEQAVDTATGALTRFAAWLRERLSGHAATKAVQRVEEAPDSPSRIQTLGEILDRYAQESQEFTQELKSQLEQAQAAGADVPTIIQGIKGNQNVQTADVQGNIHVSYGNRSEPLGS